MCYTCEKQQVLRYIVEVAALLKSWNGFCLCIKIPLQKLLYEVRPEIHLAQ